MKIKNKLALMYTMLTLTLLTILCVSIYYRFERFTQEDFFQRIKQRAIIAEKFHLEKDNLSTSIYEDIINEHLHILPLEEEYIFRVEENSVASIRDSLSVPESFLTNLSQNSMAYYRSENKRSWVGIYYHNNAGDFVVLISALDEPGILKLDRLRTILVSGVLLSALLVFIIGRWFAGLMLMPMSKITKHAKRIKAHNLHLRVPEPAQNDELKELSVTFNEMLASLEMTFNIHQNFINNASHELRTPLTTILGESEFALSRPRTADEYEHIIRNINKAALRLEVLTCDLLQLNHSYTKLSPEFFDTFYLDEVVHDLLANDEKYQGQLLHFHNQSEKDNVLIKANRQLIQIALKNIIDNAIKFSDQRAVEITLSTSDNTVMLVVSDQGVGIPTQELTYVTQPLYRGSNVKSYTGFGIGLSLTENIIKLHGGQLKIRSEQEKGTNVLVFMPSHQNSNEFLISS